MMKRIITILFLMASLGLSMSAQEMYRSNMHRQLPKSAYNTSGNIGQTTRSQIRKAKGSFEYTYFTGEDISSIGITTMETYDVAIFIPGNFAGMKISNIAFCLYNKNVITDVKAWATTTLDESWEANKIVSKDVAKADLVNCDEGDGMTNVHLAEPITIPDGGCYAGYSFTVTNISGNAGQFPVITTYQQPDQEGGFYMRTSPSLTSWVDNYGKGYGNTTIAVMIEGDFPANAMSIGSSFPMANVMKGCQTDISVILTGCGANPVSNFTYIVEDLDTQKADTIRVSINGLISLNEEAYINLFAYADDEVGIHNKQLTIYKVNDELNELTDNISATGKILTLDTKLPRKVLFEEITGNRCGWCPRGITGMEKIHEVYTDEVIPVAYHLYTSTDPMYQDFMLEMSPYFQEAPTCMLDRRSFNIDPYYGTSYGISNKDYGILDDINNALSIPSEATVSITPVWDETQKTISVTTDVTFSYSNATAPYSLAYAVIEDGLNSKKEEWQQENYYRYIMDTYGEEYTKELLGIDENSPLWKWTQSGSYIKNMKYDNVCIAGTNLSTGINGSISAPLTAGEVQTHTAQFNLTDNPVMKRTENVRVVALLINNLNGAIVNADSKVVSTQESISNVTDSNSCSERIFSLSGMRLSQPQKGINIINGKKIIVK